MKLSRRDFFVTSSVALGTFSHAFGQTPPAPAAPPPPQTSFDPLRGNVGIFTGRGGTIGMLVAPDGVVVVDTQFADTATDRAGQSQADERAADRLPHQHAPSRRPHVGQRRVPPRGREARRASQRAGAAEDAGRRRQIGCAAGVRRHDLRHDLVREGRERDRQPEVLRPRPHERRQRRHVPERQHRAHGRPDVLPAQPARRSPGAARRSRTGSSRSNRWRRTTRPTRFTSPATRR